MEASDELLTFAELAIGIAGFSGVIAAFLQRGGLHPFDRARFVNLFFTAFSALVLAFVPILLEGVAPLGNELWRISSGIMIIAWLLNAWFTIQFVIPLIRENVSSPANIPTISLWSISIVNLSVQIVNALGVIWTPCPEAFLFGLLVYLVVAGYLFAYIILYRPDESS
jgi:hypothetical protein